MIKTTLISAILVSLVTACSSTLAPKELDSSDVILDRLQRVTNAQVGMAYVDPDIDLSQFTKIMLDPLDMQKVEIVQPSRSVTQRNAWVLNDRDKEALARNFKEVFTSELAETGDYEVVDEAGSDVLRITPVLTAIRPTASQDTSQGRSMGRSRVYTEGAGSVSMTFGFSDSQTKQVLAVVKDTRNGSPHWGMNNSVTNMSDVRFMFARWARMIRARLDLAHGY